MDLGLKGKAALVTGASQGIGRAIAKALAAEGAHVCVVARRVALLEQLAQEIVEGGGVRPHIVVADLTQDDAPQKLALDALKALGKIDILVNCAGGSGPMPLDAPEQKWVDAMTLNFTRVRQLTLAVLPDMMARKWGRIINITGKSEVTRLAIATSAKAAVHGFAKGLSREVGQYNITVNCIAPGRIMSEQIRRNYSMEFRNKEATEDIPLGRYGEPEELAALAVFIASPAASYISGAVIPVDGGLRRYAY